MIYFNTMNAFKKFWIIFLSFLPLASGAVAPIVIGGIAGLGVIAGFSLYRTYVPVDMASALNFFTSCWSCQMFSDILAVLSKIVTNAYSAIGMVMIPVMAGLAAIWFAWKIFSGFLNSKIENPWNIAEMFVMLLIKLGVVAALLMAPLPRLMSDIVISPLFNIGLSINHVVVDNDSYTNCVVATAVADAVGENVDTDGGTAFPARLRHNLACEIGNVHQMTGLGMTVGWTMLNMAFDADYMHKIADMVPIFPNIPIFFVGLAIMFLFFWAMLPVPMYFLDIFLELTLDLIMLPLAFFSWVFNGWKILPGTGAKDIRAIINGLVKNTVGIAMVCVFVTFAIMLLNAMFGTWNGADTLQVALSQNDSKLLMDGLMMRNDSLVTIVLLGIFIGMFMTMIPALVKTLFSNVGIPEKMFDSAVANFKILSEKTKNLMHIGNGNSNNNNSAGGGAGGGSSNGGTGGGGNGTQNNFAFLNWLQSDGRAYINTGFIPDNTTGIMLDVDIDSSRAAMRMFVGTCTSPSDSDSRWSIGATANIFFGWNGIEYGTSPVTASGRTKIKMNYKNDRGCIIKDVSVFDIASPLISGGARWPAYIFGYNAYGHDSDSVCWDRIYGVVFTRGGGIIHNFRPARRMSDGVLGMYDTETGQFFANAGSGSFIGG